MRQWANPRYRASLYSRLGSTKTWSRGHCHAGDEKRTGDSWLAEEKKCSGRAVRRLHEPSRPGCRRRKAGRWASRHRSGAPEGFPSGSRHVPVVRFLQWRVALLQRRRMKSKAPTAAMITAAKRPITPPAKVVPLFDLLLIIDEVGEGMRLKDQDRMGRYGTKLTGCAETVASVGWEPCSLNG